MFGSRKEVPPNLPLPRAYDSDRLKKHKKYMNSNTNTTLNNYEVGIHKYRYTWVYIGTSI